MAIATIDPATGETVRQFDELTDDQLQEKLQAAAEAFRSYKRTTYADRAALLRRAADIFEAETDELARIATLEMGKTFAAAQAEVAKCV